jgi:hypothetical protein
MYLENDNDSSLLKPSRSKVKVVEHDESSDDEKP